MSNFYKVGFVIAAVIISAAIVIKCTYWACDQIFAGFEPYKIETHFDGDWEEYRENQLKRTRAQETP